jgi:hypothetical protein
VLLGNGALHLNIADDGLRVWSHGGIDRSVDEA